MHSCWIKTGAAPDEALRYQVETGSRMSKHERQIVREPLDALIVKHQVAGAIARSTGVEKHAETHTA